MQSKTDLSIIIITINTKKYLMSCLNSLTAATKKITSETIIVDNISSDGTETEVKKNFKDVKYIKKNKLYGFGENNNFGSNVAKGRYLLFLNSDTELIEDNILHEMIEWMDKHSNVGAATSALLNSDKKTYQGSGGSFPTLFRVFSWMTFLDDIPVLDRLIKPYHPMHSMSPISSNENYFKKSHEQDWITAAFFLVRREVFENAGKFDSDFNAYVEEVDLCFRIKKLGYKIFYLPGWRIMHLGSATNSSENAFIYELKNLKVFYKKHFPSWQMPILNLLLKLGVTLRIIVFGIINPSLSKIYVKAIKSV
jgi:GT2 family glycosyltransferase